LSHDLGAQGLVFFMGEARVEMTVSVTIKIGTAQAVTESLVHYGITVQVNNVQTANFLNGA